MNTKRNLRLLAVLVTAAHPILGSADPHIWTTPDGRYSVLFPSPPEELRLDIQGGTGVGYSAIEQTADGPVVCILIASVASQLQRRPPTGQIKEILIMSADTFVRSVGGDPAAMKAYTWSTLGASGPVLNYEFRYVQDSVSILTHGFIMMDDITMVRVSVSHRADMPKKRLENAAAFLKTFMVRTEQKMLPIANFVSSVASGAGGRAIKCPARAQEALRAGVSEKGITFLGTACYSFESSAEEIRTNLDSLQNKLAMGARKVAWEVIGLPPHEWWKQLTLYGNDGIEWMVIQPREAAEIGFDGSSTIVVVDTMR